MQHRLAPGECLGPFRAHYPPPNASTPWRGGSGVSWGIPVLESVKASENSEPWFWISDPPMGSGNPVGRSWFLDPRLDELSHMARLPLRPTFAG